MSLYLLWPRSASSLSYRKFIECRDIGLFRISNSISYRTSHIVYLDILKTNDFFVFFRRKFQKFAENSENSPKILKIRRKFWKFAENSPKILKIRQKFLKKKVFFEALISYRIVLYREKNPHIVSISNRVEKKLIATGWLVPCWISQSSWLLTQPAHKRQEGRQLSQSKEALTPRGSRKGSDRGSAC